MLLATLLGTLQRYSCGLIKKVPQHKTFSKQYRAPSEQPIPTIARCHEKHALIIKEIKLKSFSTTFLKQILMYRMFRLREKRTRSKPREVLHSFQN